MVECNNELCDCSVEDLGEFVGSVSYKPKLAIKIIFMTGLIFIIIPNIYARIFGIFCLIISLIVFFNLKDYKVLKIYTKYIIYNFQEKKELKYIKVNDISEWNINYTKKYSLFIKMNDGKQISIELYNLDDANKLLQKILPDKTTEKIREMISKEKKLHFDNPFKKIRR